MRRPRVVAERWPMRPPRLVAERWRMRQSAGGLRLAAALTLGALFAAAATGYADERVIGLTQSGQPIEALSVAAAFDDAPAVLLIGGLAGADEAARVIEDEAARYEARDPAARPFHLLAIPVANPERRPLAFPPTGSAYRELAESHVIWRWVGLEAPDLVLVVGDDGAGLAEALTALDVAGVGSIPARRVEARAGLLGALPADLPASAASVEIRRRLARSPLAVAQELAGVYGQSFDRAIYVPGMALIAHLALGNVEHVERLAAPYAAGEKDSFDGPSRRFGLSLYMAGHLVFAELAKLTGDAAYLRLVESAAAFGFDDSGRMREAMPEHGEMSDSIFMGTAILAAAGNLTGERRYFDMAARHIEHMNGLLLRPDGLYRHSPLSDAAWGRGNAFAALGYALTLADFQSEHPARTRLADEYRRLAAALARFQQPDGMWRQVLDHPGAYAETSATAIIGYSLLRGIREGWLDEAEFRPRVERAWAAVLRRSGSDGMFIDVSESTNKQSSLEDYLHREALFGPDERTGGMVMLFAVEMAEYTGQR